LDELGKLGKLPSAQLISGLRFEPEAYQTQIISSDELTATLVSVPR